MLEGVRSPYPVEIVWEGGKRYRGQVPDGVSLVVDGDRKVAPSPVDSVLVALGSCAAIDVVEILEKRRTPATALRVTVEFSRAPTPPRRLTEVRLLYSVATASETHHVERAVELSMEKYCSVSSSLAPDTAISWSVEVVPPGEDGGTG